MRNITDTAVSMYRAGKSIRSIAQALECGPKTIRRVLVSAGVEIRQRTRPRATSKAAEPTYTLEHRPGCPVPVKVYKTMHADGALRWRSHLGASVGV